MECTRSQVRATECTRYRLVPGETHTNVLFDLVLPAGYTGDRAEVLRRLREALYVKDPKYIAVVKIEQAYVAGYEE